MTAAVRALLRWRLDEADPIKNGQEALGSKDLEELEDHLTQVRASIERPGEGTGSSALTIDWTAQALCERHG